MTDNTVKTYVFMDIESTGLPGFGEKPKIAEISFVAVQKDNLSESKRYIPRILDKLLICCNPQTPMTSGAAWITGLYNDALEHLSPFDDDSVEMLNRFLRRLPQPICLLAHNGNKFDFPMLKMELERRGQNLADEVLCADTLEAFRYLGAEYVDVSVSSVFTTTPKESPLSTILSTKNRLNGTDDPDPKRIRIDDNSDIGHVATGTYSSSDEITPVKAPDGVLGTEQSRIPPPAPRKRQLRTDRARTLGNKKSARRRLLQDDSSGTERTDMKNNCASESKTSSNEEGLVSRNGLWLHLGIPSPPPSPMKTQGGGSAKRQLNFGSPSDIVDNGPQERIDANSCKLTSTAMGDTGKGTDSEGLLKFPEDFSDNSSDEAETLSHSQIGCGDVPDVVNHPDSLPNEVLIAAVDTMTVPITILIDQDVLRPETVCNHATADKVIKGSPSEEDLAEKCIEQQVHSGIVVASGSKDVEKPCSLSSNSPKPSTSGEYSYSEQTTPKRNTQFFYSETILEANKNNSGSTIMETDNGKPSALVMTTPVMHQMVPPIRLSYKLEEIYKRTFGHAPRVSHTAEDDCISLMKIVQTSCTRFSKWVDENAVPFSKVDKMY